ncbi:hypothetical protein PFICI_07068 [Pestalotiopsis fici W106-1]|uniref:Mid2 domain-containing protein n=1 Tax=Pestalotiopsis fici (strain W106-1 / CGMCC3.15140) TaxID=1229662 RepID=W3XA65_PESFW|nr:uncharacterized protein PFICI_07068 [Pestalotiopsis fici W106-1]ETS82066.1 hypothetical protein PFICI_07068 [Pestalotiopsis fici W106-1]
MIAPTLPPVPRRAATAAAVATAQPYLAERQVLITQTITSGDSVYTTIVTLGHGDGSTATEAPGEASQPQATAAPPSENSSSPASSGGLTQQQIGIIVGCCVGVAVLLFLAWFCLDLARRRKLREKEKPPVPVVGTTGFDNWSFSYISDVTQPEVAAWTQYHRVRPPLHPEYVAVDPRYQSPPPPPRTRRNHRRSSRRGHWTSSGSSSA